MVKVVVIITLHENLQLSPRLHEIYPNKDKNFKKFQISPRFYNKVLFYNFYFDHFLI
jgi:hypothetical protein